jgi:hypothetical protein
MKRDQEEFLDHTGKARPPRSQSSPAQVYFKAQVPDTVIS